MNEQAQPSPGDTILLGNKPKQWLKEVVFDPGCLRVEVVGGPMDGHRSLVEGDQLSVGRGEDNDLVLPLDPVVSGTHACVTRKDGGFWLEDLNSRNGTYLGDKRIVDRVELKPGSIFYVGGTCLEFMPR